MGGFSEAECGQKEGGACGFRAKALQRQSCKKQANAAIMAIPLQPALPHLASTVGPTQLTIFIANAAINFKTPFAKHHMGSRKLKINFKAAIYDLWA